MVQHLRRGQTGGSSFELLLQTGPETVAQEGDHNVRLDSGLDLVPGGPQVQRAFEGSLQLGTTPLSLTLRQQGLCALLMA
jgi:hypothetical protein